MKIILGILLLLPLTANASYVWECDLLVKVVKANRGGTVTEVVAATERYNGHTANKACEKKIGTTITFAGPNHYLPSGVLHRYRYTNASHHSAGDTENYEKLGQQPKLGATVVRPVTSATAKQHVLLVTGFKRETIQVSLGKQTLAVKLSPSLSGQRLSEPFRLLIDNKEFKKDSATVKDSKGKTIGSFLVMRPVPRHQQKKSKTSGSITAVEVDQTKKTVSLQGKVASGGPQYVFVQMDARNNSPDLVFKNQQRLLNFSNKNCGINGCFPFGKASNLNNKFISIVVVSGDGQITKQRARLKVK